MADDEATVVTVRRVEARAERRLVLEHHDLGACADGEVAPVVRHPHRRGQRPEVRVEAVTGVAHHHDASGLVGGDDERRADALEQRAGTSRCAASRTAPAPTAPPWAVSRPQSDVSADRAEPSSPRREAWRAGAPGVGRRSRRWGRGRCAARLANTSSARVPRRDDGGDERRELVGVAAPLVGVRRVERVARVRERLGELVVPVDVEERTQALDLGEGIGHELVVRRHAPSVAVERGEVVEQGVDGVGPLPRHHVTERAVGQIAPPRCEQQRPRRAVPAGEVARGDELLRPPRVEHARDRLAGRGTGRRTARRERVGEERDAQRVLRRLLEETGRAAARFAVAVAHARREALLEVRDNAVGGVGGVETVRVPVVRGRGERGDALDHLVALAADGGEAGRALQRLEQEARSRTRRAHDEHRVDDARRAVEQRRSWRCSRG